MVEFLTYYALPSPDYRHQTAGFAIFFLFNPVGEKQIVAFHRAERGCVNVFP
jgi:hypothetical protein